MGRQLIELIGKGHVLESDEVSVAKVTLHPGSADPYHYHPVVTEAYYVLSGNPRLQVERKIKILKAEDTILIPPNTPHKMFNDGDEACTFLAICTPAWTPDCEVLMD